MSLYDVHHERIEQGCDDCRPFCRHMSRIANYIWHELRAMEFKSYERPKSHEDDNFLYDANAIIEELQALAAVLEVRVHG